MWPNHSKGFLAMSTNKALTIASTVDSLIGGFRAHVMGRSLPAPAYVHLDVLSREVSVQPLCPPDLVGTLGHLLLWAHTLADVTANWWRTAEDRLHVTVHGRTSGGLRVDVYSSGQFSDCAGLVRLDPNESENVSLDELYTLTCLLREQVEGVA
jgi:hypothetical protein